MPKFTIKFDREGCIGAGSCEAACPKFWKLQEDGKADLNISKRNEDNTEQTRDIEESDLSCNLEAAQACPVNVIHIFNKETNEKLI